MLGTDRPAEAQATPLEELGEMLALPTVGRRLVRVAMFGRGSEASADLLLDDGQRITFGSLAIFGSATKVNLHVGLSIGAAPKLKQADAHRAAVLLYQAAEREEGIGDDDLARGWGLEYLQDASLLDVDLTDQHARWAAFSRLAGLDPFSRAREVGGSLASASTVLRHTDGSRLVRAGWFYSYVRGQDVGVSAGQAWQRMERVGWRRPNRKGTVNANAPGRQGRLGWTFYLVAPEWEADR